MQTCKTSNYARVLMRMQRNNKNYNNVFIFGSIISSKCVALRQIIARRNVIKEQR